MPQDFDPVAKEHGHEEVMEALARAGASVAIGVPQTKWTPSERALPLSGSEVTIIATTGHEFDVTYRDGHWWVTSEMALNYTPVFWRYAEA